MEEININELFNYFLSKKLIIIISLVTVFVLGNSYSLAIRKPMYKSDTLLILISEKNETYNNTDYQLNQNLLGTYSEVVKSRKVINTALKNTKSKETYNDVVDRISVTNSENSDIIRVTFTGRNPKKVKKFTDEIAHVFMDEVKDKYKLDNASVLDAAEVAKHAYNKNIIKDNLIYILAGLILGFGITFVIYYFDNTIKNTEVVEDKIGLKVLGVVPKVDKE